ncbi:MAG: DivIVA domain-containing protein [Tissierella sp.]|uniref:DivIVA domain-containing protein n=1 Tax=Tissierella sp. TaxID=41274 RepID=UPI003F9767A2
MLTPLDIQNKEFKRSFRGYDIKSVDIFLDEVIEDYEKVYKENVELKDKVNLFSDQIRQYNTLEETLKNTLVIAQTTAEEIISSARSKSQNITDEAEINGDKIIELAKERVRDINLEYEHLRKEMLSFKTRYQTFIEAQLLSLDKFHKDIEKGSIISSESNKKNDIEIQENLSEEEISYLHDSEDLDDLGA